jgi:hypothetical protein
MNTTTVTEVEYLTDIKFRNAVKRTLSGFRVLGKHDYGRFSVSIDGIYEDETLFKVNYHHGDFNKTAEGKLEGQLRLERQLTLAGFEMVKREMTLSWSKETETCYLWRKAVS